MAASFVVNGVSCDTRDHKCFDISVPETPDDAFSHTHMTYAGAGPLGGGMGPLDSGTPIIWHQEVTPAATLAHDTMEIGIRVDPALPTTGFIVTKMSAAHAGGSSHRYRVYVLSRRSPGV